MVMHGRKAGRPIIQALSLRVSYHHFMTVSIKAERMLIWMSDCAQHFAHITFVLNADTGYVFNLSDSMYE